MNARNKEMSLADRLPEGEYIRLQDEARHATGGGRLKNGPVALTNRHLMAWTAKRRLRWYLPVFVLSAALLFLLPVVTGFRAGGVLYGYSVIVIAVVLSRELTPYCVRGRALRTVSDRPDFCIPVTTIAGVKHHPGRKKMAVITVTTTDCRVVRIVTGDRGPWERMLPAGTERYHAHGI